MKEYRKREFTGERALFAEVDATVTECLFHDGESPLKESKNIKIDNSVFGWKYPLWYSNGIKLSDSRLKAEARSGIWYTQDIDIKNTVIEAPKTFRKSSGISLADCSLPFALETMWGCKDISIERVSVRGDYFGMGSENARIDLLDLEGNYFFDGGKNITVTNSRLISKDSFWNCENVTVSDSVIVGEYIGWNSKNLTFINCKIESNQGFCYIEGLKLVNCDLTGTDLAFEYCSDLSVDISTRVESIKNPYSGVIRAKSIGEIVLDDKFVDRTKTKIEIG